ncbi:MAG: modification methylase, partial [Selenomonadaceae bacterium]|nr:modification methylase [Selenomonadaceae bacterium]
MARNSNKNLNDAAKAKKDEFYTQLEDIERELRHEEYKEFFKGKVVLCNCDDPYESEFFKYFAMNFNALGLKKLIVTCYAGSPVAQTELNFDTGGIIDRKHRNEYAYKVVINEFKDWNGDGREDLEDIKEYILSHRGSWERLQGNGDFRSAECIEILKEADVVVTNPPFSLFREYVAQLMQYNKKFIILGNKNAITYKEIFPLIQQNKIWTGYTKWAGGLWFVSEVPNVFDKEVEGVKLKNTAAIWFTNIPLKKYLEEIPLVCSYYENPERYPKYDNYDAIEVSKTAQIPYDYLP